MRVAFCAVALALGCNDHGRYTDPTRTFADAGRDVVGRITVHEPASLTSIRGTLEGPSGRPTDIACATCHEVLSPAPTLPSDAQSLGGPHAGLRFEHGNNACRACHDPAHYDRLRLATGDSIPMTDALRLCAQCHGTQHRNWLHGAHGGMNGYWDLRRGDRVRNHCVDCHDPHTPRFPRFLPMDPPRDTARTPEGTHG